jgi:hypothetical protein
MFGHGQIEGFAEKYGMEYTRAYLDENPDQDLIERHRREIFPLLHRRRLFSGVDNFLLYDFFSAAEGVDENVFAYSNRVGEDRSLVVFNNRYGAASGWIRTSVGFLSAEDGVRQCSLMEGLDLHPAGDVFVTFRDHNTGLEYIRSSLDLAEKGLFLDLNAYQTHVFLNVREIQDDARGSYARLNARLNGGGVPSLNDALTELFLEPVLIPFREATHPGFFRYILDTFIENRQDDRSKAILEQMDAKITAILRGMKDFNGAHQNGGEILREIQKRISVFLWLGSGSQSNPLPGSKNFTAMTDAARNGFHEDPERQAVMLGWLAAHNLGKAAGAQDAAERSLAWFEELRLDKTLLNTYSALGNNDRACAWMLETTRMLICVQNWCDLSGKEPLNDILRGWLECPEIRQFWDVNQFEGALWFNRERFEVFLWWLGVLAAVDCGGKVSKTHTEWAEKISFCQRTIEQLRAIVPASGFQVEKLLELAGQEKPQKPKVTRPRKR